MGGVRGARWWGGLLILVGLVLVGVLSQTGDRFGAVVFGLGGLLVLVGVVLVWRGGRSGSGPITRSRPPA